MYMRSRIAIAMVAALLIPAGAWAQRHGGASIGGGGFHGALGGFHGAPGVVRGGPAFRGGPVRGFAPRGFIARSGAPNFRVGRFRRFGDGDFDFDDGFGFRHHHFPRNRFFFSAGFGFGYPYAYYPYAYRAYPAYADYDAYAPQRSYDADAYASASSNAYQLGEQQQKIDDLEAEVRRLRDEREAPQPASAPARSERSYGPPVTLVFRDGRRVEASNYAIAGDTFWIVSERSARKVAMSDLDVAATRKANEQSGVELGWLR